MRVTAVVVFTWFVIGALSGSLGGLNFPLSWTVQTIPYQISSTCVANINKTSWIVGGKAKGVTNDISNLAQKMQFTTKDYDWQIKNEIMQLPGSFPGQWLDSPGMYCTSGSGVYGTFNDSLKQFCYLSGNDGTSNTPQCGCCSVEGTSNHRIRCRDLDKSGTCPPLFESCIINDKANNRGLQIGGSSGVNSSRNILCFDMKNETFTTPVDTFAALHTELTSYDERCEYGSLAIAAAEAACDLMQDDHHSIIVVGGVNETHYLDSVQVCKNDHNDCQILPNLALPIPLAGAQVVGLSDCIFLVAGGYNVNGTANGKIYVGDICRQRWLPENTENMPAALLEFSIIIGVDTLCLYGGIKDNQLQNTTYCTSYYPDMAKPSTTESSKSSSDKKKIAAGAIVGIVLGVLFAIALIVGIWYCYKNRGSKEGVFERVLSKSRSLVQSNRTDQTNNSEKTMADITIGHTEQASPLKAPHAPVETTAPAGNSTSAGKTASTEKPTSPRNTTTKYTQVAIVNKNVSQ